MAKKHRWDRLGSVSYVLDPFSRGRRHPVYADGAGFFVVRRGEGEQRVIASHATSRAKCEESARVWLAAEKARELGKYVGKTCVFREDYGKPWQAGRVASVAVEVHRYYYKLVTVEGPTLSVCPKRAVQCCVVASRARAEELAVRLNALEKESRILEERSRECGARVKRLLSKCAEV